MTAVAPRSTAARPQPLRPRPFLLTSALGRVVLALGLSLALWTMTAWAMGWLGS